MRKPPRAAFFSGAHDMLKAGMVGANCGRIAAYRPPETSRRSGSRVVLSVIDNLAKGMNPIPYLAVVP
jgi:hypothetical protein